MRMHTIAHRTDPPILGNLHFCITFKKMVLSAKMGTGQPLKYDYMTYFLNEHSHNGIIYHLSFDIIINNEVSETMTISIADQKALQLLKKIERNASTYAQSTPIDKKKKLGQFFTDHHIADYMTQLFSCKLQKDTTISILDCGAGYGILAFSLLNTLIKKGYKHFDLTLYDIDPGALDALQENLKVYKKQHSNMEMNFTIINRNFILDHIDQEFDYIISNPPYFKLNKNAPEARLMKHIVHGQPNIYMFFMAKSANLLKNGGEMVFITPRSFTSGTYFKKFRDYLFNTVSLEHIHIFNTRREHFKNESILQETIITKFTKSPHSSPIVTITSSEDSNFTAVKSLEVSRDLIFDKSRRILCIPSKKKDLDILELFCNTPTTLQDLGYKISTGKVVIFRNRDLLVNTPKSLFNEEKDYAPLLWMHNFKNERLLFPIDSKKEQYIRIVDAAKTLLIPTQNYLIIKRFSSKEQHRRINIGYLYKNDIASKYVGLENHLNYLYREDRELTKDEMKRLGTFLTSSEVDQYFRILNGNTQVNAADILHLPVPTKLFKG